MIHYDYIRYRIEKVLEEIDETLRKLSLIKNSTFKSISINKFENMRNKFQEVVDELHADEIEEGKNLKLNDMVQVHVNSTELIGNLFGEEIEKKTSN